MKIRHLLPLIAAAALLPSCVATTAPDGSQTTTPDAETVRVVSELITSLFAPNATPVPSAK